MEYRPVTEAMARGVTLNGRAARMKNGSGSFTYGRLGKATSSDKVVDCLVTENNSKIPIGDMESLLAVEISADAVTGSYEDLIKAKAAKTDEVGIEVDAEELHEILRPHQRDIVKWGLKGGRRGVFAAFGLGKTIIQLEFLRVIQEKRGGVVMQVTQMGIHQEFKSDAALLGIDLKVIGSDKDIDGPGVYMCHPEAISQSKKVSGSNLEAVTLDEAAMLRGFGSTERFREFMKQFDGVPFKLVATATPAPNNPEELLALAAFLGPPLLDVSTAKTRFFQRDSTKADKLTLYPHKVAEFWSWVASWSIFMNTPSDLGHSDEGYELPEMRIHWHEVSTDDLGPMEVAKGQQKGFFRDTATDLTSAAKERRESMGLRLLKMSEILDANPDRHSVLWHELEDERRMIEKMVPGVKSIYGKLPREEREAISIGFRDGDFQYVTSKQKLSGMGVNWQYHCSMAIYACIGFKFHDFAQSLRRLHRSGQHNVVDIHLIFTGAEAKIKRTLIKKWKADDAMREEMGAMLKELGLQGWGKHLDSAKTDAPERVEVASGKRNEAGEPEWRAIRNDCVFELRSWPDDCVHMHLMSPPYGNMYKYTEDMHDFGHTDGPEHFFAQFAYLARELYRTLQPGRIAALHVKDRIVPTGITGLGFQTLYTFSDDTISAMRAAGFGFISRITIATDVVRENAQTYRLGWTNKCEDGASRGHGVPEYVLIFRKPPTDRSNGWSDVRVAREKPLCELPDGTVEKYDKDDPDQRMMIGTGYSRSGWQIDAHGFWRSSGDRMLAMPEDIDLHSATHKDIFRAFRKASLETIYDHAEHVRIGEQLERDRRLPTGFMLLQPQSEHEEIWTNITRMRTLNALQAQQGREMHVCPMQIDIVDRLVDLYTMPGELVCDSFGGLGTTPLRAVKAGRRGVAVELSEQYHRDMVGYLKRHDEESRQVTLFDLLEINAPSEESDV